MKKISVCGTDLRKFVTVYSENDGESVEFAAREFARYAGEACGADIPCYTAKDVPSDASCRVYIGPGVNGGVYAAKGEEDYMYSIYSGCVRITGGVPRGTLYGVYAFLEDKLGWRFFTPDCEVLLNKNGEIDLAPERESWTPPFEWRDVCSPVYWGDDIAAKRRINSGYSRRLREDTKRGGCFEYPGRFVHTMESLLGIPQHQQPCFSDPANLKKCIEAVRELLRANPDARVISVSQNDSEEGEVTYCTCKKCAKIDQKEGSHAGSMLRFINAVADAIKDEFPKVKIMTLAYLHSLPCPQITRPADNVIIEFSPMTMNFAYTADDPHNEEFAREFKKWAEVTKNIYVWDYVANFSFSVPIFPNFGVLRDNVRFYYEHNVRGFFFEGDTHFNYGEATDLVELRSYLLSKLMCEPQMTAMEFERCRDEFLENYYGDGGVFIGRYVDAVTELARVPDHFVGCFQNPMSLFDPGMFVSRLPDMEQWWNLAQHSAETEEQKEHVARSRLSYTFQKLLYAFDLLYNLEQTRNDIVTENRLFYEGLKKYGIRPRGMQSELPEVTDFNKNAAAGIYW